jgi:type III pantothenate kinase
MLIAVDVGNTNVTFGALKGRDVLASFKIDTDTFKSKIKAKSALSKKAKECFPSGFNANAVYVCSVVPAVNNNIKEVVRAVFKNDALLVGENVVAPIINRYRIPSQVGQDRLVNAYAALKMFGSGLIILDFGTAITFDIVSKKAEYLGGLIVPGLKLMQEALNKKTALLPYVELARPIEIIGQDTVSSIRAGIVYGVASLCDGIINRLLSKECKGFKVIATGGDAHLIKSYSSHLATIEDFLIFKGLAFIYQSQSLTKIPR